MPACPMLLPSLPGCAARTPAPAPLPRSGCVLKTLTGVCRLMGATELAAILEALPASNEDFGLF
ncbi:hypothetical protein [Silvimonas iriomotensis]|uniref:Uncharacterized protein n=1 Tax=Silvimonas iriomotensis TaxID=449662 RepID=A0ABQ2P438_9NEIS|nr:hypothetical protein [Silvimonas iriomotensis]GGP17712.1 hypothetical protein GCM10010970_01100 [Silvimonas iriomotensis]